MSRFYEITPLDTLFFRGSTPIEAGQYNTESLFPPPVSVIKGALWTAYCQKNGKRFDDGLRDGVIPFEITGLFIKKDGKTYVPAPATWYYDSDEKVFSGKDCAGKTLCAAAVSKNETFKKLGMKSSAKEVVFVVPKKDAKPLNGAWIHTGFLKNPKSQFTEDSVLLASDIFSKEPRSCVALDSNRITQNGQLYTSTHIRLHESISFVVSVEGDFDFGQGKILLGGEKRLVSCKKTDSISFTDLSNCLQYLSLVPVVAAEENLSKLVASAKIFMTSGWDLNKGFHKPSVSWIPAGAVFKENIDTICVPLADVPATKGDE